MKPLVVLCLLLLTTPLLSTQQSSEVKSEWPICFNELEWVEFTAQIQEELELTARDAADEAVKPHLVYEAELQASLDKQARRTKVWRAVGIAGWIAAAVAAIVAALR